MDKHIEISLKTILITAGLAVLFYLLTQITEVLLLIFVATILAVALDPVVDFLKRHGFRRGLAVITVVLSILLLIGGVIVLLITPIITQTQMLIEQFPRLVDTILRSTYSDAVIKNFNTAITTQLADASGGLIKITIDVVTAVASLITVLFFTAYLLLDMPRLKSFVLGFVVKESSKDILTSVFSDIEKRLGGWVRGELVLMSAIGLGVFAGLSLLQISYAVPLAVLSGLLEIVPIIGPLISAVPAIVVGFAISPLTGLGVVGLFIIVHQLENNFLVPKVMQKAVDLNPLVTMIAILIGGKLLGIVGALLAVPVTLVVLIIVRHLLKLNNK